MPLADARGPVGCGGADWSEGQTGTVALSHVGGNGSTWHRPFETISPHPEIMRIFLAKLDEKIAQSPS